MALVVRAARSAEAFAVRADKHAMEEYAARKVRLPATANAAASARNALTVLVATLIKPAETLAAVRVNNASTEYAAALIQ